jgi:phosphatidate cytidylyltransferase
VSERSSPAGRGFLSRLVVAAGVIAIFSALAWADATGFRGAAPSTWLLPVAVAMAAGGAVEAARLAAARGLPLRTPLVAAGAIAIATSPVIGSALPATDAPPLAALGKAAVACMAAICAMVAAEIPGYRGGCRALDRLVAGGFAAIAIGLPLAFMVGLRLLRADAAATLDGAAQSLGLLPLVSLIAVVKGGDIAAYVVGSLVGRHRMTPLLSPGKTWEGAAAAVAAAAVVAWLLLDGDRWACPARPWGGWPVYGVAVGLAGMLGDLAESLVKRELGAKDSGRLLGGLGGFLDLVDSLLLAAPVAWILWMAGLGG